MNPHVLYWTRFCWELLVRGIGRDASTRGSRKIFGLQFSKLSVQFEGIFFSVPVKERWDARSTSSLSYRSSWRSACDFCWGDVTLCVRVFVSHVVDPRRWPWRGGAVARRTKEGWQSFLCSGHRVWVVPVPAPRSSIHVVNKSPSQGNKYECYWLLVRPYAEMLGLHVSVVADEPAYLKALVSSFWGEWIIVFTVSSPRPCGYVG
jgi:hypothetical protein